MLRYIFHFKISQEITITLCQQGTWVKLLNKAPQFMSLRYTSVNYGCCLYSTNGPRNQHYMENGK